MIKSTRKAFTLVELIVVIVILAVLATIAFITLQDYPKDARDSKRASDIANLAKKVSIITADGTVSYADIADGGTATTVGDYTITTDADINYTALKESESDFSAPNGESYVYQYVTDADGEVCYEFAAGTEKKGTISRGTCSPEVVTALDAELYSGSNTITLP